MAIQIGQQLGSLEITALLGKGGMGEVYRARDTKLKREVAIKILPDEFSRDADRVSRFQREAEVLASLNHPNIAAIYDLQHAGDTQFLIMELVEGETLADRIERGPMPIEEALQIGKSICEALEAAHEKGIVHRDLKPANVKITPDGKVKVLDFGLAKATSGTATATTLSNSPTLLSGSMGGMIVGTAAYMSPEQARGREADQRSDIFSFGCVLYEMLTGRQAFQGEDLSEVLASVIKGDVDLRLLPANLNPRLHELLRRCFGKDRKKRWYAIGDVRVELESMIADPHGRELRAKEEAAPLPIWRRVLPFPITALIVAIIAVAAIVVNRQPSAPGAVIRFPFVLREGQTLSVNSARHLLAISRDGTKIVYAADRQLYLRSLAEMEARPIQGTAENASRPFFSPDGQWVGYHARTDGKLRKISITGGTAVTVCDLDEVNSFGPNWASDGYIYIGQTKAILRVPENGGKPEQIVTLKEQEVAHRPQLLPGGQAILFTLGAATGGADAWNKAQIVVYVLKSGERKVVISGGSDARYVPTGHIVYTLGNTLLAVPFDLKKLQVAGGPVPILEGVRRSSLSAFGGGADAQFAFSDNGSLVYIPDTQVKVGDLTVVLVDRSGERKTLNVPPGAYSQPRISPNGKQLAVFTDDGKDAIVWIYDLNGSAPLRRLTFGGRNYRPVWTPDGQRITFTSERDGDHALFWQRADGTGMAERLGKFGAESPQSEFWSPDGKLLVFRPRTSGTLGNEGLMMLTLGDETPKILIQQTGNANLSPDGKWIAYNSTESRTGEIYVQAFPPNGTKYQVTTNGGGSPLWSPDGKQLFYLNRDAQQIFGVDVQTQPSFVPGKATPLPIQGISAPGASRPYDITPDGKYFVVMFPRSDGEVGKAPPEQLNITLNWFEELRQRVPIK